MEATELESTLENDRILESPFHSTSFFFFSYRLEIGMLHVVLKHFVGWFPTRVRTLTPSTDSLQEDPMSVVAQLRKQAAKRKWVSQT